jgi:hypothetical protein
MYYLMSQTNALDDDGSEWILQIYNYGYLKIMKDEPN